MSYLAPIQAEILNESPLTRQKTYTPLLQQLLNGSLVLNRNANTLQQLGVTYLCGGTRLPAESIPQSPKMIVVPFNHQIKPNSALNWTERDCTPNAIRECAVRGPIQISLILKACHS